MAMPSAPQVTRVVMLENTMKVVVLFLTLFASAESFSRESCAADSLGFDESSSKIEKLFYTGTCHYRNEDYGLSVESWEKITSLVPSSSEDEELKIDVLNNLGYMKFFGYGTLRDQGTAISYWREAILLGHYEAEYHLCHAYADRNQTTFDLAKARKHCAKARLIYRGKADSNPTILSDIETYLEQIDG